MKRSNVVTLSFLGLAALGLTGCDEKKEIKACVDQSNVVQPDGYCYYSDKQKAAYKQVAPHPIPNWWYYHWVYGGSSRDNNYTPGQAVIVGGSGTPTPGVESVTPSEAITGGGEISGGHVSYGGFGVHGGEGGEGGAHGEGGGE
ncbi:MAG: hypothetical protein ACLPPV_10920 [Candidatus Korobacteraceae bacterium]|jgi:hypothetical protein